MVTDNWNLVKDDRVHVIDYGPGTVEVIQQPGEDYGREYKIMLDTGAYIIVDDWQICCKES